MKMQKKGFFHLTILLVLVLLGGCSPSGAEKNYGTEKEPAGVGQTVIYDGWGASKDKNRFKAEITLEDVVRGREAEDIWEAASGYGSFSGKLELEDNQEILIARFTFSITDMEEEMLVELGERDVNIFKLVSQDGAEYDYFLQRRYVDGNLFVNASKGSAQTGCMFYLVDKQDENPKIVFMPGVNGGLWFKTNLGSEDKEKVEAPIRISDWRGEGAAEGETHGGTFHMPLPIGEYGYMHCRSSGYGEYEIEIRVDEIIRGDEAKEKLRQLDRYGDRKGRLKKDQEYLLAKITVNVPSADLQERGFLDFYIGNCALINSAAGTEYDSDNYFDFVTDSINAILPGGASSGWFGFVVDKADASPMMYYRSLDDKKLFFKLDEDYRISEEAKEHKSLLSNQDPVRDNSRNKGDWRNPYGMGDTVELDYKPAYAFPGAYPFTGSIQVLEAYRGEAAQWFLGESYDGGAGGMEPVVLKLRATVEKADGADAPVFDGGSFTVISGRGGEVITEPVYDGVFPADGLYMVYPGATAEGYAGFLVPEGTGTMEIYYGEIYDRVEDTWIELEFTEKAPGEIQAEEESADLSETAQGVHVYNVRFEKTNEKLTGLYIVDEGQVYSCIQKDTYSYRENRELFERDRQRAADIVKGLNDTEGMEGSFESDEEELTITIQVKVEFSRAGEDAMSFVLGTGYRDMLNEEGLPQWQDVKELLLQKGYEIQ